MPRTACRLLAREVLAGLLENCTTSMRRSIAYDRQIRTLASQSEPARRLMALEAIGPQTATALVASMGDPHVFKNGRQLRRLARHHAATTLERRQGPPGSDHSAGRSVLCARCWCTGLAAALRVVTRKTDAEERLGATRLKDAGT